MPPTARRFPQLFLLLALLLTIAGAGGLDASAKPGTGGGGTSQCNQGAWSVLARPESSNTPFLSQQDCTQYLNGGGVPVPLQTAPPTIAPPTPSHRRLSADDRPDQARQRRRWL